MFKKFIAIVTTSLMLVTMSSQAADDANAKIKSNFAKLGLQAESIKPSKMNNLYEVFTSQGLFYTDATGSFLFQGKLYEITDGGVMLTTEAAKGGKEKQETYDIVLVATGRRPYTDGLGLEELGIATDKLGRIECDDHFRTSVPSIYAIGDCIAGPMLAHKAEEEGIAAVEIMAGYAGHVNYDAIPGKW